MALPVLALTGPPLRGELHTILPKATAKTRVRKERELTMVLPKNAEALAREAAQDAEFEVAYNEAADRLNDLLERRGMPRLTPSLPRQGGTARPVLDRL